MFIAAKENPIREKTPSKMDYKIETLAVHAGQIPDSSTLSRAVPVYRTTAYNFKNTKHAADLFALKESGNIYSRIMNPTNDILEKRLCALEGGAGALALSSGTAAIAFSILNILKAGDELVSARNLYGGTYTLFDAILPQYSITARFTDVNDFSAVEKSINERTRALYIETVGNPSLDVADIEGYAKIARNHHIPLIVDSTFTPPPLLRPIDYGADIVIHSLSKWICGHGTAIGGAVIDAGKFDWSDPKFALYSEPDKGYHGLRFGRDLSGTGNPAFITRLRTVGLRNMGPTLSPDSAWIFLQGLETLPLRMERHCSNAKAVAEFLKSHPGVEWVRYPGLEGDPSRAEAEKYLVRDCGGVVVFGPKGGYDKAVEIVDNIPLFSNLANVGDAKSLILHPASTSHSQLGERERLSAGVPSDLIRLSIGIENKDDIISALDSVL